MTMRQAKQAEARERNVGRRQNGRTARLQARTARNGGRRDAKFARRQRRASALPTPYGVLRVDAIIIESFDDRPDGETWIPTRLYPTLAPKHYHRLIRVCPVVQPGLVVAGTMDSPVMATLPSPWDCPGYGRALPRVSGDTLWDYAFGNPDEFWAGE